MKKKNPEKINSQYQKKALVLFSGGLDSILAVKILQKENVTVTAIIFQSLFWSTKKAEDQAKKYRIPYFIHDFSRPHLKMVKKPDHGYGQGVNPCLDCHALMLKTAARYIKINAKSHLPKKLKPKYDFLATGEVLGQRPFSQNKKALAKVAEIAGIQDWVLRPLSAKLLPPTEPEKKGWISREALFGIESRSRRRQIELAKKLRLKDYPQPAGGCLLCEKEFARKFKAMLSRWPNVGPNEITLLKIGRHFWVDQKTNHHLIILGRNQEENQKLEIPQGPTLWKKLVAPLNFPGPTALVLGLKTDQKVINQAREKILQYSKNPPIKPEFMVK